MEKEVFVKVGDKIYIPAEEYARLCRLDGKIDALISYIELDEERFENSSALDREIVKRIIGMCDE